MFFFAKEENVSLGGEGQISRKKLTKGKLFDYNLRINDENATITHEIKM